jgi:hypothetical protein
MKLPQRPPSRTELLRQMAPDRLLEIVSLVTEPTISGKYLRWDDLRHRNPPAGLSLPEWWFGLKLQRTPDKSIPPLQEGVEYLGIRPLLAGA